MTAVFADRQPADNIINAYFRERRFIGSGDRRFIAEKSGILSAAGAA